MANFNITDTQVSKKSTDFDKIIYKVRNLWTHKMEKDDVEVEKMSYFDSSVT